MNEKYKAILKMCPPKSKTHPPMPLEKRAAQFMPFAALSGYAEAVAETARTTDPKAILAEDSIEEINRALENISSLLPNNPTVSVCYFVPDATKDGGKYLQATDTVQDLDSNRLLLAGGETIPIENIRTLSVLDLPNGEDEIF